MADKCTCTGGNYSGVEYKLNHRCPQHGETPSLQAACSAADHWQRMVNGGGLPDELQVVVDFEGKRGPLSFVEFVHEMSRLEIATKDNPLRKVRRKIPGEKT